MDDLQYLLDVTVENMTAATFGVHIAFPAGSPLPSGFTLHNGANSYPCA